MDKKLFLLDGMALVYRAHFALIAKPIFTSKGVNTSALYGFTNTLIDLLKNQTPTHLAVAFDTSAPTQRHIDFPAYKAQREEMPEELSAALPFVRRMLEAFHIPAITLDGFEADDIIGTLARQAEKEDFTTWMVTPDKDFAQLVTPRIFIYKPGRMGNDVEILGVDEVKAKWGVENPLQVIDILGLWGDTSDNIPGVPGVGEKTAQKLIAQYGSIENLLEHAEELKGKLKESLRQNRDQALLCKQLATINITVPLSQSPNDLLLRPWDETALQELFIECEFNSLGRRLFSDAFKAGRGFPASALSAPPPVPARHASPADELDFGEESPVPAPTSPPPEEPGETPRPPLRTILEVPHHYTLVTTAEERAALIRNLQQQAAFCFDSETTSLDPHTCDLIGLAFSWNKGEGFYIPFPEDRTAIETQLREFSGPLQNPAATKIGHNLKFDLRVLLAHGLDVAGPHFDTMIAHCLLEPDQRHGMDYLAEVYLGYSPIPITRLIGEKGAQISLRQVPVAQVAEYAAEDADVTWQLHQLLGPLLQQKNLTHVFSEVEMPLLPTLVAMESEGIALDLSALQDVSGDLTKVIMAAEADIHRLAGLPFNLNSPRQLGEILFDRLQLSAKPKKTKTGQYVTNEQTLQSLSGKHEIVGRILDYRAATKLKSTYVDALPEAVNPKTGRIHTSFGQALTATGRLQSQDPNLQNIPIRTEQGKEIRKAFIPRGPDYLILSADYSQIELRVIAALSGDPGMLEAFGAGHDIHTATAARVYSLPLAEVTGDMRRKAKMVNFGIIYGISAFGLAQRLGIPNGEASQIINEYFRQYPKVQAYMQETIAFARAHGYVETITGRRRYLRDIRSANATIRNAMERTAINAPIQGTAADMIKIAMARIHQALHSRQLQTRLLLQVHDELVFDLYRKEETEVRELVTEQMQTALPALPVPIVIEIGVGKNWLEAH